MTDNNPEAHVEFRGSQPPTSERDALLGPRRTPPPRYSSIDGETHKPQGANDFVAPPIVPVHVAPGPSLFVNGMPLPQPQETNPFANPYQSGIHPGWYSYLPGHGQCFPPGIEHLTNLDEVTITNRGSKYRIWHHDSHQLFTAKILSPRYCGGGAKGDADIKVFNNADLEVLNLCRTLESNGCCCSYNDAHIEISFTPGHIIGVVQGSKMEYTIMNPSGDILFILEGQGFNCCSNGGYNIANSNKESLGFITMERTSCCGRSNVMRVEFPSSLDIRSKALLMSAGISIRDLHWN